ncbi:MAG: hypothetical protein ACJAYB_001142 [Psychromonas sp.]|jgi:hypothetical protein
MPVEQQVYLISTIFCFNLCLFRQIFTIHILQISTEKEMNRKKKLNSIFDKRIKRMNAKKNTASKPKYISKAERAKIEASEQNNESQNTVSND